jgi:hypothetical protein
MNRHLWRAAALILAMGLQSGAAHAGDHSLRTFLFHNQDPRLTATGIGVGVAGDAATYALVHKHGVPATRLASPGFAYGVTTFGCAVVYPIAATVVLHRALTPREAYTGIADCIIPFIGGWIVDATLPHTAWYDGLPERRVWRRHHHRHKK